MITSLCCRQSLSLPFLLPLVGQARCYAQQHAARTPRSAAQAPSSQVKDRTLPPKAPPAASTSTSSNAKPLPRTTLAITEDTKAFNKVRQAAVAREMEESGQQFDMLRMSVSGGLDPAANKAAIMDLCIPSKSTTFRALRNNWYNSAQNVLSMFRLANDFAFPGIVTKWRFHPQLFRTKSTSDRAWIAPYRHDLLDIYRRINQAIASGDPKTLTKLTAYEYQEHAFQLLQRNMARMKSTGCTYSWSLAKVVSPVKILSLRAFPLYHAAEEPKYGNRNCVQAIARFETLQSLVVRNARGQVIRPDGTVAEEGYAPEPRRVLEYLICENKMFYKDGWYVRDQVFEDVKPRFKDILQG